MAQARQDWSDEQPALPAARLIFLDETWATTSMTLMRGRAPKGQRCRGFAPAGHWRTTTFVCALSTQGLRAPLVLDGPINGPAFRAWVEQFLERVQSLLSRSAKNARWINCKLVLSQRSQFFHNRRFFSSQAKLRSTIQRLGMTLKVCNSLRFAICTVTC